MRAMVLEQPAAVESAPLHARDIPEPALGPGEIRVRVHCCGLCHTDLHTVEGELSLPKLPVVPGHQIVGTVEGVGAGVKNFRGGERVGIPWLNWTDGTCRYCRAGQENLCEHARFTGLDVNGGYAEYTVVNEAFAYQLPEQFLDVNAAPLLCAGLIGYRSLRLSNLPKNGRLGLYGFGASAHIVIQVARHLGHEVYVFTRSPKHRDLAMRLGAAWVGGAEEKAPGELDSAIIFAPAGPLVLDALRAIRKGGTVALAGITMSAIPTIEYSLIYYEKVLRSVANLTRQDAREFLALAAEVPVHTEVQVYPLDSANQALTDLKHSRIEGAGVLQVSK
jgi:alcohol dehydrogenase, propanol-preferring